jgi:hypothetical protein
MALYGRILSFPCFDIFNMTYKILDRVMFHILSGIFSV